MGVAFSPAKLIITVEECLQHARNTSLMEDCDEKFCYKFHSAETNKCGHFISEPINII